MSETSTEPDIGELEFLMSRYDRIIESTMTVNQIIHTTFYVSVVAIAGTAGVLPQFSDLGSRIVLYVALSFLFVAMFGWTRTYLTSRRTLEKGMSRTAEVIAAANFEMENVSVEEFFSTADDYDRDHWESRKENMLMAYYLGVAGFAIVALAVDVSRSAMAADASLCLP